MAKSQRASSRKRNNAAIRNRLYHPATDARTERLSAKLQELASKPRQDEERAMDVDEVPETVEEKDTNAEDVAEDEEMDIDGATVKTKSKKKSATAKRPNKHRITKSKKPRNNMIFPDLQARKKRQQEAKAKAHRKRSAA